MTAEAPSPAAIAAFGGAGVPVRLAGGRGSAWRVGDLVLKPLDGSPASLEWQATVLAACDGDEVRIATPLRSLDDSLLVDGWLATRYLEGEHRPGRWLEVIAAGDRFHRATRRLERPDFLDARDDPWATGDRVAWTELDPAPFASSPHLARLLAWRRPVGLPNQIIHGDLGGNVLFAPSLDPAILDVSPYWRPADFGTAIVVADALVWEGADETLVDEVREGRPHFGQLLIRALIYRLVTDAVMRGPLVEPETERRYRAAVDIARGGSAGEPSA
jgi:uncharacterized protein (TIGR02569 family)